MSPASRHLCLHLCTCHGPAQKSSPLTVVNSLFPTFSILSSIPAFSRKSSLTNAAGFSGWPVWKQHCCHAFPSPGSQLSVHLRASRFRGTDSGYLSSKMTDELARRPVTKFINTDENYTYWAFARCQPRSKEEGAAIIPILQTGKQRLASIPRSGSHPSSLGAELSTTLILSLAGNLHVKLCSNQTVLGARQ